MEANNPKTPEEMYDDLAVIEEGGSIYTLQRTEPFEIEYVERISRTSKSDADQRKDKTVVYLSTKSGKEYRMMVDCDRGRCAMEHIRDGSWVTYSNALSGFRYRSPNHPENGRNWKYDES
ncbi:hypothetical protein [Natrarchaeobius oligotrophus]|uniref:hypothetical protein n=1 Tax=Natrarchaeobius oligotrophus TaxID=3455743 RepID=UPI000F522E7D|nr:hypothetical protein [Natrarchaeobius chitinivorans]